MQKRHAIRPTMNRKLSSEFCILNKICPNFKYGIPLTWFGNFKAICSIIGNSWAVENQTLVFHVISLFFLHPMKNYMSLLEMIFRKAQMNFEFGTNFCFFLRKLVANSNPILSCPEGLFFGGRATFNNLSLKFKS